MSTAIQKSASVANEKSALSATLSPQGFSLEQREAEKPVEARKRPSSTWETSGAEPVSSSAGHLLGCVPRACEKTLLQ